MRTPHESFLLSGNGPAFKDMCSKACFEVACDYALLQLVHEMAPNTRPGSPTDPYVGLDANAQITGARRLVAILFSLHEPVKPQSPIKREGLNYG